MLSRLHLPYYLSASAETPVYSVFVIHPPLGCQRWCLSDNVSVLVCCFCSFIRKPAHVYSHTGHYLGRFELAEPGTVLHHWCYPLLYIVWSVLHGAV